MRVSQSPDFEPDSNRLNSFLDGVVFRKCNLWPNYCKDGQTTYFHKKILDSQKNNNIFEVSVDKEIIALLSFRTLDWDTSHFGFPSGSIDFFLKREGTDKATLRDALDLILSSLKAFCDKSKMRFVSIFVDSWDFEIQLALQKMGFRYISTSISGFLPTSREFPEKEDFSGSIGNIQEEEIGFFKRVSASNYFSGGRFYLDPNFDKSLVQKMYENLVENSYRNQEFVLVYRINSDPVGLFICNRITIYESFANLRVAPLRFLVVAPEYRGKQIGLEVFRETIRTLRPKCDLITTGLEVHNMQSLNLHSKLGFKFNFTHNVFHFWNE